MKVNEALICPECDEVFRYGSICPSCLNEGLLRLDKIINEKAKVADGISLGTLSSSIGFNSMGESIIIIGDIKRTFKVTRRYLRVNYSNSTLEESGPIGDEVEYPQGWFTCEEITEIKHCDGCQYLSFTEEEHKEIAIEEEIPHTHRCNFHHFELHHYGQHPKIPKPPTCTKSYKKREA